MSHASYRLSIPKPCLQDWNSMTDAGSGRFCDSCKKVVTDFTAMSNKEIEDFFIVNKSNQVCGRFKNEQLNKIIIRIPSYVFGKKIATWKKFLLILLICFGKGIFPISIIYGSSQNLYAQTQTSKNTKKKHKKNRVALFKESKRPDKSLLTISVSGYVVREPILPLLNIMSEIHTQNPIDSESIVMNEIKSNPYKNNQPPEEEPKDKLMFILPATLSARRKKENSQYYE